MLAALPDRIEYRLRRGEIHIGDPERQQVPFAEQPFIVVPFKGVRAAPLYAAVEIYIHA